MESKDISLFESKPIRKLWHNEEWYFSVVDIIGVLTDSPIPRNYWSDLKRRDKQLHEVCVQLKMLSSDGKNYKTDTANTEGVLRIIMSVPSPQAEPFKLWLAQLGKREIDENQDPELGFDRLRELYKAKGYTDDWIKERMQSIDTRKRLTNEWQKRGVQQGQEYSILTATIAKGTFGITPSEHKALKGIEKENLRDHMTPLELIFTALGEETTRILSVKRDAQGFNDNHDAAQDGGTMAGNARKNYEKELGENVVSPQNYLDTGDVPALDKSDLNK
jgi:DNA-damage-inducible protein D